MDRKPIPAKLMAQAIFGLSHKRMESALQPALSASTVDELESIYAVGGSWDFHFTQLSSGALNYNRSEVHLSSLSISVERTDMPMRVRMQMQHDGVTVSFALAGEGVALWQGNEMSPQTALVFGGAVHDYITPRKLRTINFETTGRAFAALGLPVPVSGISQISPAKYRRLMTEAQAILLAGRGKLGAEARILSILSEALGYRTDAHSTKEKHQTPYYRLLTRAEDLYAESDDLFGVEAAAEALAVSPRTLQRAFSDLTGVSFARYFRILRLHEFRRRLIAGDSNTMVTTVALDCGFENLGRLSNLYREWFGETPVETRRKVSNN